MVIGNRGIEVRRTLCFSRRSLFRGALIITRRTLDGALKWALRDFLREEWRASNSIGQLLIVSS